MFPTTRRVRLASLRPELFLVSVGMAWSALAALDPFRAAGSLLGPALSLAALILAKARRASWQRLLAPLLLTLGFAISARVSLEFRADSDAYFAYLRSVVFDGDLDFTNEWEHWGRPLRAPTETGLQPNSQSIGPAVLWSPFYLLAHGYVIADRAWGQGHFPADGYSAPYRRSTALGTVTVVVLGSMLLFELLRSMFGPAIAALSVTSAFAASPVVYYTFVVPMMAHGVTFGAVGVLLWCWGRAFLSAVGPHPHGSPFMNAPSLFARALDSARGLTASGGGDSAPAGGLKAPLSEARPAGGLREWILLGAALGLVAMCRWQGALYVLLVLPMAVLQLRRRQARLTWFLAAAAAGLVAFAPQMIAWRILFGNWLTVPQGPGFLKWNSPNWLNTLISADHGFFNWTPVMFLGFVGLLLGLRRFAFLFGGGLLVFLATAWTNGSVPIYDWQGGDAFGARRFSVVVPLMACGLGALLEASSRVLKRAPLLAPAAVLIAAMLWNLGFVGHFRARRYPEMAPLDRLARDQSLTLRDAAGDVMGWLAGPPGRALVYKIFSAEYFYTGFNRSGTIHLYSADERYLLDGWGTRSRRVAQPLFRRALFPEACVRIPLDAPFDLRAAITARTPRVLDAQRMAVVLNGTRLVTTHLTYEWRDVEVGLPADLLVPGENVLCLRFARALSGEPHERVAAHVSRIQLP